MRSETHCNFLLKEVVADAVKSAKKMMPFGMRDKTAVLMEDQAPGHVGDNDGYLKKIGDDNAAGWKAKRTPVLQAINVKRAILSRHSTPTHMVSDQLHGNVHRQLAEDIRNSIGLTRDLRKRWVTETASGARKGPNVLMLAQALFDLASKMKPSVVMAAYVRCGII